MTVSKAPAAGPSGLTTTGALPRHRCMLGRCTPATVTAHAPHCQEWNVFRHDTQPYFSAPRDKSLNDALYGQYGRPMIVASRQPLAPVCLTVGIARQLGWPCCSCCQAAHQHWGLKLACAEQAVSRHRVQGTRGCGGSQEPPRLPDIGDASAAAASGGFGATALHRFRDELGDVRAGFSYISHSSNRCALLQTLTPCTDWLLWLTCEVAKASAGSPSHLPAQSQKLSASQCTQVQTSKL